MNISQAATACGLPVKTLRYYETLGLVIPLRQPGNDYREYTPENIQHLVFLQRSRAAGFSLAECRQLLQTYLDGKSNDPVCRQWLQECMDSLDSRMLVLDGMRKTLMDMLAGSSTQSGESNPRNGMSFLLVDTRE